jgi:hypothetical protein
MTLDSLVSDAKAVLSHWSAPAFSNYAVVGTRLGSLVAAKVVSETPWPVALWEPVIDPARFFGEAARAQRMSQLARAKEGRARGWRSELSSSGQVELLGHSVYPPLVNSLDEVGLLELLGTSPRSVFVARFGARDHSSDGLMEELSRRGFRVTYENHAVSVAWWFDPNRPGKSADLVPSTALWLRNALSAAP